MNLWEEFLDFIEAHPYVRWAFFVVLLIVFWGNWSLMGVIAGVWVLHEVLFWVRSNAKR